MPHINDKYTSGTHSGEIIVNNAELSTSNTEGVTISYSAGSQAFAADGWSVATSDNADLSRTVTITPNSPGMNPKSSKLVIKGTAIENGNPMTITREIEIIVVGQYNLSASVGEVNANQEVDITLILPYSAEEPLPEAMFPLQFQIEAKNNTLRPGNDILPVETGFSLFNPSMPGYHFLKTVDYDTYMSLHGVIPCHFKTTVATGYATDIMIVNEYFKPITDLSLE